MIIRPNQHKALTAPADRDFEKRAIAYCRLKYVNFSQAIPDDIFVEMVRNGIARGRDHGITWESRLVEFLELMFSIAPNFDEHPEIAAILDGETQTPEQRFAMMLAQTAYDTWQQVAQRYDPEAWGVSLAEAPELYELRGGVRSV